MNFFKRFKREEPPHYTEFKSYKKDLNKAFFRGAKKGLVRGAAVGLAIPVPGTEIPGAAIGIVMGAHKAREAVKTKWANRYGHKRRYSAVRKALRKFNKRVARGTQKVKRVSLKYGKRSWKYLNKPIKLREAVTDYLPSPKDLANTTSRVEKRIRGATGHVSFSKGRVASKLGTLSVGLQQKDAGSTRHAGGAVRTSRHGHRYMWINPTGWSMNNGRVTPAEVVSHEYNHYTDPALSYMQKLEKEADQKNTIARKQLKNIEAETPPGTPPWASPRVKYLLLRHGEDLGRLERKTQRANADSELRAYSSGSTYPHVLRLKDRGVPKEVIYRRLRKGKVVSGVGASSESPGVGGRRAVGLNLALRRAGIKGSEQINRMRKKYLRNMFLTTQHVYGEPTTSQSELHSRINSRLVGGGKTTHTSNMTSHNVPVVSESISIFENRVANFTPEMQMIARANAEKLMHTMRHSDSDSVQRKQRFAPEYKVDAKHVTALTTSPEPLGNDPLHFGKAHVPRVAPKTGEHKGLLSAPMHWRLFTPEQYTKRENLGLDRVGPGGAFMSGVSSGHPHRIEIRVDPKEYVRYKKGVDVPLGISHLTANIGHEMLHARDPYQTSPEVNARLKSRPEPRIRQLAPGEQAASAAGIVTKMQRMRDRESVSKQQALDRIRSSDSDQFPTHFRYNLDKSLEKYGPDVTPRERRLSTKLRKKMYRDMYDAWGKTYGETDEDIAEASIDAVTPSLYLASLHTAKRVAANLEGPTDTHTVKSLQDRARRGFGGARSTKKARMGAVSVQGRKIPLYRTDIEDVPFQATYMRGIKSRRGEKITVSPSGFRSAQQDMPPGAHKAAIKSGLAHELVHASDSPTAVGKLLAGLRDRAARDETYKNVGEYYSTHPETHAYSAIAGRLGMRSLKKAGYTPKRARRLLTHTSSDAVANSLRGLVTSRNPRVQNRGFEAAVHLGAIPTMLDPDTHLLRRSRNKLGKEMFKGGERAYGSAWSGLSPKLQALHSRINSRVVGGGKTTHTSNMTSHNVPVVSESIRVFS